MIKNEKILNLIMLLIVTTTFSQIHEPCKTLGENEARANRMERMLANPTLDNTTQYVYNVRINVFNDANNTNFCTRNGIPFGEDEFLEIVANLNRNYNKFNIYFKYKGYRFYGGMDGNGYLTRIESEGADDIYHRFDQMSDLCEKDAININFVDKIATPFQPIVNEAIQTFQSLKAQAYFGRPMIIFSLPSFVGVRTFGNASPFDIPVFEKSFIVNHEMGHTLGLFHVFQNFFTANQEIFPNEHVTRNPLNPDGTLNPSFNALTAGDMILDTPAMPNADATFYTANGCIRKLSLTAPVFNVDGEGTPLDFENIVYGNFMSYTYTNGPEEAELNMDGCDDREFTIGQGVAMRSYLENPPGIYSPTGIQATTLNMARNTVESLFEPYASNKIVYPTILSTTDNENGTVKVCRGYNVTDFKFQPGFNYQFLDEDGVQVLSSANNETYPVIVQPIFNCPVRIVLGTNVSNLTELTGNAETVCRGQECVTESLTHGEDINVKVLGSMNYTIEQLNTVQVKDPELYERLKSEYYHILKMYTESGAKVEKVIYKP